MKTWTYYADISTHWVLWPTEKRQIPVEAETRDEALEIARGIREAIRAELGGTNRYVSSCHLSAAPRAPWAPVPS